jgi:single-stranded-DNA-specific exonuclease
MIGEDGSRLRAIAFRVADAPEGLAITQGGPLHVAGRLRPDSWRGKGAVQIEVADIAKAH